MRHANTGIQSMFHLLNRGRFFSIIFTRLSINQMNDPIKIISNPEENSSGTDKGWKISLSQYISLFFISWEILPTVLIWIKELESGNHGYSSEAPGLSQYSFLDSESESIESRIDGSVHEDTRMEPKISLSIYLSSPKDILGSLFMKPQMSLSVLVKGYPNGYLREKYASIRISIQTSMDSLPGTHNLINNPQKNVEITIFRRQFLFG